MTRIDQAQIDAYAEVSGDRNPLHVDPDFATGTSFGTTIAHGHLLIGLLGREIESRYGEDWAHGGRLDVKFVAPVRSGDDARVELDDDGSVRVLVGEHVCVVGAARLASEAD